MDGGDNFFFLRILEEADDDGRDLEGSTPTDLKESWEGERAFLETDRFELQLQSDCHASIRYFTSQHDSRNG